MLTKLHQLVWCGCVERFSLKNQCSMKMSIDLFATIRKLIPDPPPTAGNYQTHLFFFCFLKHLIRKAVKLMLDNGLSIHHLFTSVKKKSLKAQVNTQNYSFG
jgi:hypothetical protein